MDDLRCFGSSLPSVERIGSRPSHVERIDAVRGSTELPPRGECEKLELTVSPGASGNSSSKEHRGAGLRVGIVARRPGLWGDGAIGASVIGGTRSAGGARSRVEGRASACRAPPAPPRIH